jgi:hypothetical protein
MGASAHARAAASTSAWPHAVAVLQSPPRRTRRRIVQATSLGAEDMVLTDLIARHHLPIAVATLDTGKLHAETLALARASSALRPHHRALRAGGRGHVHFVREHGELADAPQHRACARPAARCASSSRWRACWPAQRLGHRAAPRAESSRAEVPFERDRRRPRQVQPAGRLELGRRVALHRHCTTCPTTRCTTSSSPASAASPARAPSPWARTSAPAAGGGKTKTPRNAACTSSRPKPPASAARKAQTDGGFVSAQAHFGEAGQTPRP